MPKIGRVWQTSLINPDLAAYAELCGSAGYRVTSGVELQPAPSLVEVLVARRWV